ncbi:MAG: DUF5716 family protein [Lachnospiraceae bacterium]|nr:DUF5716 family protein [Lachnospiraceae bacterium]
MIQATNELVLGIDLNPDYAQVTYWHQSVREPLTLTVQDNMQLPTGLRQDANGIWSLWDGSPALDTEPRDVHRISCVYAKIERQEKIKSNDTIFAPEEILSIYLQQCISGLKLLTANTRLQVMITVKELSESLNRVIVGALLALGVDRRQVYVQDYLSSFYYYTVNQKKEIWAQDVALLTVERPQQNRSSSDGGRAGGKESPLLTQGTLPQVYERTQQNRSSGDGVRAGGKESPLHTQGTLPQVYEEAIVGYVMHIDRSTKPAIARVEMIARQPMGEAVRAGRSEEDWKKEKDRLFFELLKKVFERRQVAVSYLMGDYFDKSWAVRSIQFLCTRRRAYQGLNLYSRGACYAALERAGISAPREMIFGGNDMVERNIGMEMCIRGKENYYSLVNASVNWYEAHHVCEFIPRGEREIRVISRPMTPGEPTVHTMRLPGLPRRPDRATRLRMTVYFTSPVCCHIDVEDRGVGGRYKSSGLSWSREISF